jgi:hypothetical protein
MTILPFSILVAAFAIATNVSPTHAFATRSSWKVVAPKYSLSQPSCWKTRDCRFPSLLQASTTETDSKDKATSLTGDDSAYFSLEEQVRIITRESASTEKLKISFLCV